MTLPPPLPPVTDAGRPLTEMEGDLLRLVLSHIDEIVYDVREIELDRFSGTVVLVGAAVRRVLGYDPADILGDVRRWLSLVHPDDRAGVLEATRSIFAAATPGTRLYRLPHKRTGEWRWIEDTVVPLRGADGTIRRQFGVLRDVTERVHADEAIRDSERRHRELVEHAQAAIVTCTPDGRLLSVNPSVERALGYAAAAAIGRPLTDFVATRARDEVISGLRELRPGTPLDGVVPVVTRDGEERVWACRTIRMDVTGREPYLLINAVDITELKRAEQALRRSEAKYRALVEEAAVGIYRSSRDGRFVAMNRALIEMLGYEREEELTALDLARDVYAHPGDRARVLHEYGRLGRYSGVEVDWRRKDGQIIRVRLSGRPIRDADGRVDTFEMVAEDVTRRAQLEQQLRQSQKMEAVGQLTSGIAHDFNNILTAIVSNIDLAVAALPPGSDSARSDLEEASAAAGRATQMVRKLMAFARREQLELAVVDVAALVAETVRLLRRLLPESIDLRAVDHGQVIEARVDRGAVEQMLLNLATNARDAMASGGALTIETRAVDLGPESEGVGAFGAAGPFVAIDVRDTGTGIAEGVRSRIFEPFFTTKPHGQGTGLGLAMVYGLAKQHGGYVTVDSTPGVGSTFTLYLPRVPAATEAPGAAETAPADGIAPGTETLLLVEDDASVRRTTARALARAGYRVLEAGDGLEALEVLEREPGVDLVVTDVVMPRASGAELYERARERGWTPLFLFTSGYTGADRGGAVLDPSLPFLRKPWTTADLAREVRRVLGRR